jgi:hypothetical protein
MHVEGRDEPLALREVVERAEVDVGVALVLEGRHDHEADHGYGDETPDHRAQAERRRLEETAPRETLAGLGLRHRRLAAVRRDGRSVGNGRLAPLGLDGLGLAPVLHRRVARPEKAEDDRYRCPDRRDQLRVDDQSDEDARHAHREADRVQRGPGEMRPIAVLRLHHLGFNSRPLRRVNDVTNDATGGDSD